MLYNYNFGFESICDIIIVGENIVIATELDENTGTSITNAVEKLATKVCKEFDIPYNKLIWIEHYDGYELVSFEIDQYGLTNPRWIKGFG